jgi:succinate dehydrogenase/fumarate reductase flavoprotein subunit
LQSIQEINWTGKPQVDYMDHLPENKGVRGRILYPKNQEGKMSYGGELIRQLKSWATTNRIIMQTNHQVVGILRNHQGEVIGLKVLVNGQDLLNFRARKAVIFGSGGYTRNSELMLHFQRGPHFGGCAASTNTGDFIKMAGIVGAKLGNMAGAFRAEIILEQTLSDPYGVHSVFYIPGDSVIEVNRYGRRIMDEKRNYHDRTMTHFVWDAQRAEWTNMLVFMIFDQRTASLWQGFPPYPVQGTPTNHIISASTWDELSDGIASRLKELSAHTGGFSLDPDFRENLKQTVTRFNEFAKSGKDKDFSRGDFNYDREWTTFPPTVPGKEWPPTGSVNYTMFPLSGEGPYYAIILGAGTLDTNGGPIINSKSQVMNVDDKPIPGLYGAGNCIASPTANAYWGGGSTIGPAMTFGYIAGLNAAAEPVKVG